MGQPVPEGNCVKLPEVPGCSPAPDSLHAKRAPPLSQALQSEQQCMLSVNRTDKFCQQGQAAHH